MAIRTYRIPPDERQTEYIECEKCGRSIVNVIEIDGIPYGTTCGLKELGIKVTGKKAKKQVAFYIQMLEHHTSETGRDYDAEYYGELIFKLMKVPDPYNRITCHGKEYGQLALSFVRN
jgi:hypothetical protein